MRLFSETTFHHLRQQIAPDQAKSADWQRFLMQVDGWCASPPTLPNQSGGWIHNYICPTHWMPLVYDGNSPDDHRCPAGDSCEGAAYDEAWLAWRHRQIADMSRNCALAYTVTGNTAYLAEVERVLLHYAVFYAESAGADSAESWMITARVFNQALTEALWAIPLIHAFDLVADALSWNVKQQVVRDFLAPLGETMAQAQDSLIEKDHIESNYMAWFNAALGTLGFTLNDANLVERAIDGAGGFIKHISAGVLADGMQYEVTPYYHNFVVLAYLILAEAALANGRDLYTVRGDEGQSIQSMWRALVPLTLPDGTIADLGDGSYWIDSVYDRELIEVYEIATSRDDDSAVAAILHHAYARKQCGRDSWAALLFGKEEPSLLDPLSLRAEELGVRVLPNSGVAVLQPSAHLAAVAPFGAHRGSHSHGDQLSLQVWPFSNDAGCALYGLKPVRFEWYQTNYAHNTLVIDGISPKTFSQALHSFVEDEQVALLATDAFSANVTRTIKIERSSLVDQLAVTAETTRQFDWVFHIEGQLSLAGLTMESCDELAAEANGGQHLRLTERANGIHSAEFTVTHNNQTYSMQLTGDVPFDLLVGNAPGTSWDPTQQRTVMIGRTHGKTQTYRTIISHD